MWLREGLSYIHLHPLLNFTQKNTDTYDGIGLLTLKEVLVVDRGGLLLIHLHLLNFTHRCTDIYDTVGFLALKGIIMVKREVYPISIPIFF